MSPGLPKPAPDADLAETLPERRSSLAGTLVLIVAGIAFVVFAIFTIGDWDFSGSGSGSGKAGSSRTENRWHKLLRRVVCWSAVLLLIGWVGVTFWREFQR